MKCTYREFHVEPDDLTDTVTPKACEEDAVVEIKSLDPDDPSGGRFCMEHARFFVSAPPSFDTALTPDTLKLGITVRQTVRPHDYESAEVMLHVEGFTAATTDAQVEDLLAKGRIVYTDMAQRVGDLAKDARQKGGWT